ncbi:MAG: nucleotide exchange factor GrpE [Clostridia bacterium]|nr:nucleotide exchange factor GrpE [Clostridia bacterium]
MLGKMHEDLDSTIAEKNNGDENNCAGGETPVIGDVGESADGAGKPEGATSPKEDSKKEEDGEIDEKTRLEEEIQDEPVEDSDAEKENIEELKLKIAELEQEVNLKNNQINELMNRLKRLQADFDNYRKRTQREKKEMAQMAGVELVEKLLPVLDNFERALKVDDDFQGENSFKQGMAMIYEQFCNILNEAGLEPIEAVGEQFDPTKHEAVMRVESSEHDDNTVVGEIRKGYRMKGKVIRPAMVQVAYKKDAEE